MQQEDKSLNNDIKSMAKSSGIVAFVQVFQMAFGLIRNKTVALLIGTSGFGVWSLMHTFIEMLTSFSVLGIDKSGVREIAKTSVDEIDRGKTIFTFRILITFLSVVWSVLVFIFAKQISVYLFGIPDFIWGIKFLSIVVIFTGISREGYAILNAVRSIKYLAYSQIIGAIAGSLGAIILIWYGKEKWVAPALSVVTITLSITTSYYVHKLKIKSFKTNVKDFIKRSKLLVSLGLGFSVAGLVSTIMTLLSKSYLSETFSLDAVGVYQASWTVSNLYVGIILNAMGIDFMPRISKVSDNHPQMCQMINKQIEFGITLATVGACLVLLFAPLLLRLLYSSDFVIGTNIVRWQFLGVILRVIAFPFSFAIMASAKPIQYALIQTVFWIGDYLLLRLFSQIGGFDFLGINYFVAYCFFLLLTFLANKHNINFKFSKNTRHIILISLSIILYFWMLTYIPLAIVRYSVGIVSWIGVLVYMLKYLKYQLGLDLVALILKKIKK